MQSYGYRYRVVDYTALSVQATPLRHRLYGLSRTRKYMGVHFPYDNLTPGSILVRVYAPTS